MPIDLKRAIPESLDLPPRLRIQTVGSGPEELDPPVSIHLVE